MNRIGWGAVLAALLAAPAWGKEFTASDTLKPDEGVLVTTMICGRPVGGVQLFQAGKASGGFWGPLRSDASLHCRKDKAPTTLRLKAGNYYIGQLYSATDNLAVPEDKAPHFSIAAGKLTYVGDIYAGQIHLDQVDVETLRHVAGRMLTVLNHEPLVRQALEAGAKFAGLAARYPFVADPALPPPVAVGPMRTVQPGQMQGMATVSSERWKRDETGKVLVCPRLVPLPKGTKSDPAQPRACAGEFVSPETYIAAEHPGATVEHAGPQSDDNGPLVIVFVGPAPAP